MPDAFLNWIVQNIAAAILKKIVEQANFEIDSEHAQRIEQQEEIYGKIKEKLANWKLKRATSTHTHTSDPKDVENKISQIIGDDNN